MHLGITWQDLFDKKIKQPSSSSLGQSDTRHGLVDDTGYSPMSRRIHQVYKYVDETGKLLYENVRYYPKSFRQRGYNEKGEWLWNLEGVRRVPYRLPELIKAKENNVDIFLCEGEKDADVLRELGFIASSFKNWTEDFNQYIHGCHLIIVQDHDLPGIAMANEAARLVLRSAASVKVLDVFADRVAQDNHGLDISITSSSAFRMKASIQTN
jgi:hypothetical protein